MTAVEHSGSLDGIVAKIAAGRRLEQADGEALFATADLHTLGRLAHEARRRLHGDVAYYNINRHINYTNVCVMRCRFCGFYRRSQDDAGGYVMSAAEVTQAARQAAEAGATEVHIVGGLHPKLPFDYYLQMLHGIRSACPGLHIKAFTAIEIVHFARLARKSIEQVLTELIEAGLGSLPGGGAEVFAERVQAETFKGKAGAAEWFEVHEIAHRLGIKSNATMLYGHIETPAERVSHIIQLRELQDRSGGFGAFVPLSFIPAGSELAHLPGPTGVDDLRTVAVARLMLDNIPHIKTFWVMTGAKLSQVALLFGADDLDGTVVHYDITHREGSGTRQELTVADIRTLIRQAGLTPVERDSLYNSVIRQGKNTRQA